MDSFAADVRYGVRMLLKTPLLSAVAVLTIALGVGLTTHTFSVVYGSVIRGLDLGEGNVLAAVSQDIPSENSRGQGIPYLDLLDFRQEQTLFEGLAAYSNGATVNLADEGSPPERYEGAFVTANLFEQVGVEPILGRGIRPEEESGASEQVAVISHDVWQGRYAGAPDLIGRSVRANSRRATIVGVMPEGFHFPFAEDVWLPIGLDAIDAQRGLNRYPVVGRLREGVTLEQADAQMDAIAARLAGEYPETNEGVSVWLQSYEDRVMPDEMVTVLWLMLLAVGGVLLIACFNVANLLLARSAVRSKEVAVRSALGADRGRIVRQLLIESTVLAALGGLGGVLLAWVGVEAFNAAILEIEKPYWIDIRLDGPAVVFTLAITAFASLAAGTIPALRASGGQLHTILQDESRGSSSFRMGRFSAGLVVAEIALSCALLVAAGMTIKSVVRVNTIDLGFEDEGLFTARLGLFEADYPDDESRTRFYDRLLEELRAEPGVEAAGLTTNLPALGPNRGRIALEGVAYPDLRDQPLTSFTNVTPGYFATLGVDLSEGRDFDDRDRAGGLRTAIVNERFATRHFGSESPLERRFRLGVDGPWLTIVGVVPDVFAGSGGGPGGLGASGEATDQFFLPIAQGELLRFVSLAVRTRGDPAAFGSTARQVVARLDPGLPLYWVRTMEEAIQTGTWVYTIFGSLFTVFGFAALFLAAVGLYGVMAFSVSRRVQEMGIRMAMGAGARDVFGLVLGKGLAQLGLGAALGLGLGWALARPLAAIFFEVEPSDPTVYAAILVTMTLVGFLACAVPARRATRVELVEALRPD